MADNNDESAFSVFSSDPNPNGNKKLIYIFEKNHLSQFLTGNWRDFFPADCTMLLNFRGKNRIYQFGPDSLFGNGINGNRKQQPSGGKC